MFFAVEFSKWPTLLPLMDYDHSASGKQVTARTAPFNQSADEFQKSVDQLA